MQEDGNSAAKIVEPAQSCQSAFELPARYQNKGVIARGGMGTVLRAYDLQLERDVAIKLLPVEDSQDPAAQERFAREAKILASLNHANIVKILSWGVSESGSRYYVMEYLDGRPLAGEIGNGRRLDLLRFHQVSSGVLSGLACAHENGLVHRDIKPSNIMLCQDSDGRTLVKLIDFGVARLEVTDAALVALTRTGDCLGSPAYMSPEQCRGQLASRLSEIYSFGCVMFECLSGEQPFQAATTFEIMSKHVSEPAPVLRCSLPYEQGAALTALVARCLEKDAGLRPQSVLALKEEIDRIFSKGDWGAGEFSTKKKGAGLPAAHPAAHPALLGLAICLVVLVVTSAVFLFVLKLTAQHSVKKEARNFRQTASSLNALRLKDSLTLVGRWESRLSGARDPKSRIQATEALADALLASSRLQRDLGEMSNAEKNLGRTQNLLLQLGKDGDGRRVIALTCLADLKEKQGDLAATDRTLQEAEDLAVKVWGSHWHVTNVVYDRIALDLKRKDLDAVDKRLDRLFALWSVMPDQDGLLIGVNRMKKKSELGSRLSRAWNFFEALAKMEDLSAADCQKRRKICHKLSDWFRMQDSRTDIGLTIRTDVGPAARKRAAEISKYANEH
jgi:hypothetical protein